MSDDPADLFRGWQRAASRRRLMMFGGAALLAVAGGLALAFLRAPSKGIDSKKLSEIRDFLPTLQGTSRRSFAAAALAELEVVLLAPTMWHAAGKVR